MSNATVSELIERVQAFNRDAGGRYITPELVLGWLNEAQTDIAAREGLLEEEVTANTDGTNTVAFPTDEELLEIVSITLGDDDRAIPIASDLWESYVDTGVAPAQTVYRIFENQIEFYPTPAAATLVTLRHKRLSTSLVDGEDVHELPGQLERKLVEYAKAQSRFMDGDFTSGNNWMGMYEVGLKRPSSGRERFFTQPIAITRRPGVFDLQPEARHV